MQDIEPASDDIYQYLNFDQISQYQKSVGHIALKYCQFYTGDFWKKLEKTNKKSA
jgi:hypothetical protein